MSEMIQSMNPVNNKSGSLKSLNLAMLDSMIPMATISTTAFMIDVASEINIEDGSIVEAIVHGKNKFDPRRTKNKNLFALAHSISANLFPEYSRIIAS